MPLETATKYFLRSIGVHDSLIPSLKSCGSLRQSHAILVAIDKLSFALR